MKILPVTEADAAELLAIYAPYVANTAVSFEYEIPTLEEFTDRIAAISSRYPYLKAVDDNGRALGYAYGGRFHPRKAYEWSAETTIYLASDCRRQGIGRALYSELERRLARMGILNLNACIAKPRGEDPYLTEDSPCFHRAMGYTMVGTFHCSGYKFGRWYDMIWMEKLIGDHRETQPDVIFPE